MALNAPNKSKKGEIERVGCHVPSVRFPVDRHPQSNTHQVSLLIIEEKSCVTVSTLACSRGKTFGFLGERKK